MFFLRTVRLSLTQLEVFTQKQHISFKMAQVPPSSGIRRSISCLFWSTTPAKLYWLFRAVLRNLTPRNLILGVFIRMAVIFSLNRYLRSPGAHRCIECPLLFSSMLDLCVVNPRVMCWYLDCCWGRKYYRVGARPCGLDVSLWGPIFPDFSQDLSPWSMQWWPFRIVWVLVDTHKLLSC